MAEPTSPPENTLPAQPLADPESSATLAQGAASAATPVPQATGLESGMKVISTPQGKASVDKNAPASVTEAFAAADAASALEPVYSDDGKRIIGGTAARPGRGKGKLVVMHSMVTTAAGKSYTRGQFVDPKDLSGDDLDVLTGGNAPALVPFEA